MEQGDFLNLLQSTPRAKERQLPRFEDMDWKAEKRRLLALQSAPQAARDVSTTACHPLPPVATRGTEEELDRAERDFENTKNVYMEGMTVEKVQEAYQSGELSESDYLYALDMMGERDLIEQHEKEGLDL